MPFVSTPLAARVHKPTNTALGLRLGSEGFGFQVTDGPWGAKLIVPPRSGSSAFARGSYLQGRFSLALSLAWETFDTYYDGSQYITQSVNGGGFGLDVGYFWSINLETGRGYFGPRIYS